MISKMVERHKTRVKIMFIINFYAELFLNMLLQYVKIITKVIKRG